MACTQSRCTVNDTELRFAILGDFGGQPDSPYYTTSQVDVSAFGLSVLMFFNIASTQASCRSLNKRCKLQTARTYTSTWNSATTSTTMASRTCKTVASRLSSRFAQI